MASFDFANLMNAQASAPAQQGGQFDINNFLSNPIAALGIGLLTSNTPQEGIKQGIGLLNAQSDRKRKLRTEELEELLLKAKVATLAQGGEAPSDVRKWEYYNQLSKEDQTRFTDMLRSPTVINMGGIQGVRDPVSGGLREKYNVTPKPSEMPGFEGEVTAAKKAAELAATKEAGRGKAQSALTSLEQQSKLVTDNIDKALGNISGWSTGYGNALFSNLPNTDARELNNTLATIKANVGFDKLQSMRENSPTGGALGAVSDFETKLLQAVNGALDPLQADQLAENLKTIKELYPKVVADRKSAFNTDYGQPSGNQPPNAYDVFVGAEDNMPAELPPPGQPKRLKFNRATGRLE